ncbi:MAG: Flp pilus assembly protein CpaB [Planctomycetaceae bacterium]|nr:Flp pilus assembly protein CpaB [Planctomycetaceae bacterium]
MRPKSFALLMLALGCGLVAAIGVNQWMTSRSGATAVVGENVPVFVAVADIGLGEVLSTRLVKEDHWPKDKIPAGVVSRLEDVDGRRTRAKLYAGEPILETKLFGKGDHDQGATALIPKGYRVVSVKVDPVSGSTSMILPGDRVDVMVHLVRDVNHDIPETVSRTILQDVKVFAVNDIYGLENQKDGTKSIVAKTFSLLVTPSQAARIMLACQLGNVQLVMRGMEEEKAEPNAQATPSELLGAASKADRQKEDVPEPSKGQEQAKGFVDLLNSMKKKSEPEPEVTASVATKPTWTIRVLKPGAVEEVQFEAAGDESGSSGGGWKVTSSGSGTAKAEAKAEPKPEAKPEPKTEPKSETPASEPATAAPSSKPAKAKEKTDKG